jgi:hypothetical protein
MIRCLHHVVWPAGPIVSVAIIVEESWRPADELSSSACVGRVTPETNKQDVVEVLVPLYHLV